MLRHNMTVVTKDNRLKREVQRVTASTASNAEFVLEVDALARVQKPDLVIYDARTETPPKGFHDKLAADTAVIYVVDDEKLLESLPLLDNPHACSVMGHGSRFDDDEFIASATKALRGNIFGLQKYFPWGVTTFSVVVSSGEQKSKAIEIILRYATLAGVRGPVRDRIQTVADELMMNALYHAPVDKDGQELYRGKSVRELSQLPAVLPIEVTYGSSGRYFGIAVRDGGGSLTRDRTMKYLAKARSGQADIEQKIGGAGLGLVSVLRSVSKLVFNVQPGTSTEVIGLFDMELFAKGKVGARSVHVFTAPSEPEPEAQEEPAAATAAADEPSAPIRKPAPRAAWWVAAALFSLVTAIGTAYVMRRGHKDAAAAPCPPDTATGSGAAEAPPPSAAREAPDHPPPPAPRTGHRNPR
jgi:hypothetical protein